jgi:hypothetical protein
LIAARNETSTATVRAAIVKKPNNAVAPCLLVVPTNTHCRGSITSLRPKLGR